MISKTAIFSSKKIIEKTGKGTSSQFTAGFYTPIELPTDRGEMWTVALRGLTTYNRVFNITAAKGNNTLQYKRNSGDSWSDIVFPDGRWSIQQLNEYIHSVLRDNGYWNNNFSNPEYGFTLSIRPSTVDAVFEFKDPTTWSEAGATQYYVRIPGDFNKIVGFTANTELTIADDLDTRSSDLTPDITAGIDRLFINCSIVDFNSSYANGESGKSLSSFTIDVAPGALISMRPNPPTYYPVDVSGKSINRIDFWVTSQSGEIVSLNGEELVLELEFKKIKM